VADKVTQDNFESEVLNSDLPVLVDFWADWCAPCKMMEPILEELSEEYSHRLKIVKLNVDESRETASKYGIMSIPTMIIFDKGSEVARTSGAFPKENLCEWINSKLGS
jgi:thioredoxin 1